ncbi:MAG: tetratricopeptide repeat protein [Candidatus Omnitrophica bacterium]|nr:tetratricopeptide repeat protein [Candidatus Omnitrophota bacterium]
MRKFLLVIFILFLLSNFVNAEGLTKEEEALLLAQKAFNDGFYDTSLNILENFLINYPNSPKISQVNLYIGQCYLYQNRISDALNKFEGLLNDQGSDELGALLYFWIGEAYFRKGDFRQAITNYKKFMEVDASSSANLPAYYKILPREAHFKIINCLYKLEAYVELEDSLNSYVKAYPEDNLPEINFYLGEAYFYQNKFAAAEEAYAKAIESTTEPKLKSLFGLGLAWLKLKLKKYPEAEEILEKIDFFELDEKNKEIFLLSKGILRERENKFEEAAQLYETLMHISKDTDNLIRASLGKADCLYSQGKYWDGLLAYQDTLSQLNSYNTPRSRNYADYLNSAIKGICLKIADDYYEKITKKSDEKERDEILENFGKILEQLELDVAEDLTITFAGLFLKDGNIDLAIKIYKKAIAKNKNLESLFYPKMAEIYKNGSDFCMAIEYYKKALDVTAPDKRPFLHFQMAQCYEEQLKFDAAIEEYIKITHTYNEENPLFIKALLRLAQIYENREHLAEARNIYERIASLNVKEADFAQQKLTTWEN